jgi:hypothetical protein
MMLWPHYVTTPQTLHSQCITLPSRRVYCACTHRCVKCHFSRTVESSAELIVLAPRLTIAAVWCSLCFAFAVAATAKLKVVARLGLACDVLVLAWCSSSGASYEPCVLQTQGAIIASTSSLSEVSCVCECKAEYNKLNVKARDSKYRRQLL